MKNDISTREDIELLVNEFYSKVQTDPVIGFIFTDIAKVNWVAHLPIMYDFFENMLFYTGRYTGNPMELHKHLDRLMPLTPVHFQQWYHLFSSTVDDLFSGTNAEVAKLRAKNIADIMKLKIVDARSGIDKLT